MTFSWYAYCIRSHVSQCFDIMHINETAVIHRLQWIVDMRESERRGQHCTANYLGYLKNIKLILAKVLQFFMILNHNTYVGKVLSPRPNLHQPRPVWNRRDVKECIPHSANSNSGSNTTTALGEQTWQCTPFDAQIYTDCTCIIKTNTKHTHISFRLKHIHLIHTLHKFN